MGECWGIMGRAEAENGALRPNQWSTCSNSDLKDFYKKTGYLDQCLKTPDPPIQGEIIHYAELYQYELFNPTSFGKPPAPPLYF